jgi:preprotein translocase subunit Sec61beta
MHEGDGVREEANNQQGLQIRPCLQLMISYFFHIVVIFANAK